jgi:hypothetical protein
VRRATGFSFAALPAIGRSISRWPSTRFFGLGPLPLCVTLARNADDIGLGGLFCWLDLHTLPRQLHVNGGNGFAPVSIKKALRALFEADEDPAAPF